MERMAFRDTLCFTGDQFVPAAELIRRLPYDLARRCQALPLAEDHGRVTVAVANPEDVQVCDAIRAALGPESCVVQGDPLTIEALLADVWGETTSSRQRLRVAAFPGSAAEELWRYAEKVTALLGGDLSRATAAEDLDGVIGSDSRDCDLVILGGDCRQQVQRLISRPVAERSRSCGAGGSPFAILAAQELRWPLERILLVVSGAEADSAAVDWTLRLACPSGAKVTALAVVPPMPGMYHGLSRMEQTLRSLLSTDTALGCQMRQAGKRLVESRVESTLRLRQGQPVQQICREMAARDCDLAIMATEACRWRLRQLKGDPICSILKSARWPMLIVEPNN